MGLKPIISFEEGEAVTRAKVRGDKAVVPGILKLVREEMIPHTPYCILGGSVEEYPDELAAEAEKLFGAPCAMRIKIGAAISINAGHKIAGIVFKGKPRR